MVAYGKCKCGLTPARQTGIVKAMEMRMTKETGWIENKDMHIDSIYKMIISWLNGLGCCFILGNVSASSQDMAMKIEKDLGLTISADIKVSGQCGIAALKGNNFFWLIMRNIVHKEKELIICCTK